MADLIGALDALLDKTCPSCGRKTRELCTHEGAACLPCCRDAHGDHCRTCNGYGTTARADDFETSSYSWRKPICPTCVGTGKETA